MISPKTLGTKAEKITGTPKSETQLRTKPKKWGVLWGRVGAEKKKMKIQHIIVHGIVQAREQ